MKKKISIVVLLLLLTIGFAAVTTNLIINSQAKIGISNDYDVYFSSASTEAGSTATITNNGYTLNYSTKSLVNVGDYSELFYEVYNESTQYDADVEVTLNVNTIVDGVDYSDYIQIFRDGFIDGESKTVGRSSSEEGNIVVELIRPVTENIQLSFTVSMSHKPIEQNSIYESDEPEDVCDFTEESCSPNDIGSKIKFGDEEFYYLKTESDENNRIQNFIIPRYNLGVGEDFETPTNRQEPTADGVTKGIIAFQNKRMQTIMDDNLNPIEVEAPDQVGYWVDDSNQLKSEYGTSYPAYVYDSNCIFKQYIDDYISYLNSMLYDSKDYLVTGRIMTKSDIDELMNNGDYALSRKILNSTFWLGDASSYSHLYISPNMEDNRPTTGNAIFYNKFGVRPMIIIKYFGK